MPGFLLSFEECAWYDLRGERELANSESIYFVEES